MIDRMISGAKLLAKKTQIPVAKPKRIVLVGGCFDVMHYGHLQYLKNAKKQGDVLVVALENDSFILAHKGRSPFHSQKQRAEMLLSLTCVDYVILLPTMRADETYRALVDCVSPNVIAVTAGDPQSDKKAAYAKAVGAQFKIVNRIIEGLSSSTITTYARIVHD